MEIGPYSSVRAALNTAKNAFVLEAEKVRANATLVEPAVEARQTQQADALRNVALAVDVAQQTQDVMDIITDHLSEGDDSSDVTVIGSEGNALDATRDVVQAQRRAELISLYDRLAAEGRGPESRLGSRIDILS